jgi:NarL family two-component system response regulator LiaR
MAGSDCTIRVLIVDDHQVVRQGLRTFLELQPQIEVVGEAADGSAAVELVRQLEPDIVLMDLVMPGCEASLQRDRSVAWSADQVMVLTSFVRTTRSSRDPGRGRSYL